MKVKQHRKLLSLLLILLLVTACSSPGSSSTQEQIKTAQPGETEAVATPTETPTTSETSLCANTYYPVREGATWAYKSTGSPAGDYTFTDTITSVRDDGFTLTSQFGALTRTQEWGCEHEGLVALQLGGASAATLNNENMDLNLVVDEVNGVTYPSQINAGDQWQHNLSFAGEMNFSGQTGEATGNVQANFTALGKESVTVPAGTFDAMKIQLDSDLNINAKFTGISVPVTISSTYTYWLAEGVGWVKASGTGEFGGQSFSETIELQSYNIP
jgi:hypothetical protein